MKTLAHAVSLLLAFSCSVTFAERSKPEPSSFSHKVVRGDTIGELAEKHLSTFKRASVICAINGVSNPNHVRMGVQLAIPTTTRYFVAPFLKSDERTSPMGSNWQHMKVKGGRGVVVGVYSRNAKEEPRFRAVRLWNQSRYLLFDSADHISTDDFGYLGAEWHLDDLDGDGGIDLVMTHTAGTGVNLTIHCFHGVSNGYKRVDLLKDPISIGFLKWRRNKMGARQFVIQHRKSNKVTTIDWSPTKQADTAHNKRLDSHGTSADDQP